MDTTKAQQIALDDALVAPANRLEIRKCNHRLSFDLKSNKPTLQVVLDALKLTPFYNAFQITANVPEIYMQEFWDTVSIHHTSLRFKMNDRSHTLNMENFIDIFQIHKEYYVVSSRAEPLKAKTKYKKKVDEPVTSPKKKPVQASKGTRLKSKAKVTKPDKKKQHAKKTKAKDDGEGNDHDDDSDDDDSDDERTKSDSDDIPDPNLTNVYQTEYEEEDVDEGARTPSDYELTNEEKLDDEESMHDEEDEEVIKEMYDDVNVNL
nr:hypothetical protein [Tanacetum cinerariifolium]